MQPSILLFGYGGHGQILAELLFEQKHSLIGVFDDKVPAKLPPFIKYLDSYNPNVFPDVSLILGIGKGAIRQQLIQNTIKHTLGSFMHHTASVSISASIGNACVILQNVVIQSNVSIGDNCLINAATVIDHDAIIEDHVDVSAMCYIGNNSTIAANSFIPSLSVVPKFGTFPPL